VAERSLVMALLHGHGVVARALVRHVRNMSASKALSLLSRFRAPPGVFVAAIARFVPLSRTSWGLVPEAALDGVDDAAADEAADAVAARGLAHDAEHLLARLPEPLLARLPEPLLARLPEPLVARLPEPLVARLPEERRRELCVT
jgi:hypothetical protein